MTNALVTIRQGMIVSVLHDRALAERWLAHLMAAASSPQAPSPGSAATTPRRQQPRSRMRATRAPHGRIQGDSPEDNTTARQQGAAICESVSLSLDQSSSSKRVRVTAHNPRASAIDDADEVFAEELDDEPANATANDSHAGDGSRPGQVTKLPAATDGRLGDGVVPGHAAGRPGHVTKLPSARHQVELAARNEQHREDQSQREEQDREYQAALEMDRLRAEERNRLEQERAAAERQMEERRRLEEAEEQRRARREASKSRRPDSTDAGVEKASCNGVVRGHAAGRPGQVTKLPAATEARLATTCDKDSSLGSCCGSDSDEDPALDPAWDSPHDGCSTTGSTGSTAGEEDGADETMDDWDELTRKTIECSYKRRYRYMREA